MIKYPKKTVGCDKLNMIKRILSIVLSVNIFVLSFFMLDVYADTVKSGSLSKDENKDSVIWTLNDNGDLTISGSGKMKDFLTYYSFDGMYNNIKNVSIEEGIVNIGSYVFSMCEKMSSISIPLSVKSIGENAFADATSLKNIYYEGTEQEWKTIIIKGGNDVLSSAKINYKEEAHICSFDTVVNTIQPTCVTEGVETRKCSCGNEETATIPATGVHNFEWNVSVEAACTTDGEEKQHCTVCNALGETRKVNKSGHKTGEWEDETKPTCTENGLKVKKCESCGEILEQETIAPTGHDFGEWKTAIKETEDHDGEEKRTCKTCKFVETRVIDKIQSNNENVLGDADDDGKVSAKDARLVLQVVAGLKENKELNYANADVNKDKFITAVDARFILQIVAGLK